MSLSQTAKKEWGGKRPPGRGLEKKGREEKEKKTKKVREEVADRSLLALDLSPLSPLSSFLLSLSLRFLFL